MTPDAGPAQRALTVVWRHRTYRALSVAMVLSGVSVSSYVPLVSLFLVRVLGASDAAVGLFTLTLLVAPVVGIITGRISDRLRRRTPLFVAVAVWVALGRLAMGVAPTFATAVAAGVVFGAFGGVLNAQVFAVLKDTLEREREARQATIGSVVRTAYALGWMIGPLAGSELAAVLGLRGALAASGLLVLLTVVPLLTTGAAGVPHPGALQPAPAGTAPGGVVRPGPAEPGRAGRRSWGTAPLWLFALACLLALTGDAMRLTYLPVLAVDRLGMSLALFGALVAVAPAVELLAMPAAGALSDRFGLRPVMLAGMAVGAVGYGAFAVSSSVVGLLVGQVLNACFIAVVLGSGVTYAQRLDPGGGGFAASVFFAAQSLSVVTAGAVGSLTATWIGLPGMFAAPALLCAAGGALLLAVPDGAHRVPVDRPAG